MLLRGCKMTYARLRRVVSRSNASEADVLGLDVLIQSNGCPFSPESRFLDATKWCHFRGQNTLVYGNHSVF